MPRGLNKVTEEAISKEKKKKKCNPGIGHRKCCFPEVRRNLAYLHLRKQQEPEWLEPKEQILEIEERR